MQQRRRRHAAAVRGRRCCRRPCVAVLFSGQPLVKPSHPSRAYWIMSVCHLSPLLGHAKRRLARATRCACWVHPPQVGFFHWGASPSSWCNRISRSAVPLDRNTGDSRAHNQPLCPAHCHPAHPEGAARTGHPIGTHWPQNTSNLRPCIVFSTAARDTGHLPSLPRVDAPAM